MRSAMSPPLKIRPFWFNRVEPARRRLPVLPRVPLLLIVPALTVKSVAEVIRPSLARVSPTLIRLLPPLAMLACCATLNCAAVRSSAPTLLIRPLPP